jgi:hypothetical protein
VNVCCVENCQAAGVIPADRVTLLYWDNRNAVLCFACSVSLVKIERDRRVQG